VAEWSCSGLQSRLRRFDSDPSLQLGASEAVRRSGQTTPRAEIPPGSDRAAARPPGKEQDAVRQQPCAATRRSSPDDRTPFEEMRRRLFIAYQWACVNDPGALTTYSDERLHDMR